MLASSQSPSPLSFEVDRLDQHLSAIAGNHPLTCFSLNGLNSLLGGVFPSRMTAIAASPGIGKTTLLLQMTDDLCLKGHHVLFVTTEMPPYLLIEKSISRLTGGELSVSDVSFAVSQFSDNKNPSLAHALEVYRRIATNLLFTTNPSIGEIENLVTKIEEHFHQPPVIVIDYIQRAAAMSDKDSTDERSLIAQYVVGLSEISKKHGSAIFAASTMVRNQYSKSNPDLTSCGGSAAIEYEFDSVVFLTPSKQPVDDAKLKKYTASAQKNRYGPLGKAEFLFDGACATFKDLS